MTYLGDLGGLLDFIMYFGFTLSSLFVSRLFHAALVKQAYRIQSYLADRTPYYKSSKRNGILTTESESYSDEHD